MLPLPAYQIGSKSRWIGIQRFKIANNILFVSHYSYRSCVQINKQTKYEVWSIYNTRYREHQIMIFQYFFFCGLRNIITKLVARQNTQSVTNKCKADLIKMRFVNAFF